MIIEISKQALIISGFVFNMMLLIEYINVQTQGNWQMLLGKNRKFQHLFGVILGAIPGCLGAFTVVSLYAHGIVSLGVIVAAMIATSGDEVFVMFSLFPLKTLLLIFLLAGIAYISGYLSDKIKSIKSSPYFVPDHRLELHDEEICHCLPNISQLVMQIKTISLVRVFLQGLIFLFLLCLILGILGPDSWDWQKITIILCSTFSLFVVCTVPEHFLQNHIWEHILKKHMLSIFSWTLGALIFIQLIEIRFDIESWVDNNYFIVLTLAVFVGIIPESGPHLFFVTLFAEGALPFSILLANSIVQDGHGMLPMLSVSKRVFISIKTINVIVGFIVGVVASFLPKII